MSTSLLPLRITIKNLQSRQTRKDLNYYEYKLSGEDRYVFLVLPERLDDTVKSHITYFGDVRDAILKDQYIMNDWGLVVACVYTPVSNTIESFTNPLLVNANAATYMSLLNQLSPTVSQGEFSLCDCGARKCGHKDSDVYDHATWCTVHASKPPF